MKNSRMLGWWMRAVGAFYLLKFVAVVLVKAPIKGQASEAIGLAAAGDPVARFLVDTWVIFGLEMAALGIALLIFSRLPEGAKALVLAILGVEISGIVADIYQLARGHSFGIPGTWIAIHTLILLTGLASIRRHLRLKTGVRP